MLNPYEFEILPCTFFEVHDKEKLLSSTTLFRKRANTTDKLTQDIPNNKFNRTIGNIQSSLPALCAKPSKNKAVDRSMQDFGITVPKHKYDLLLDQNRLKDQKIQTLQAQVKVLKEKNQELHRALGIMGIMEGDPFIQTTKLNEVTNQLRDKKRMRK